MLYEREQKTITAIRLKELRENYQGKGISHEKLAESLEALYGERERNKKNNQLRFSKKASEEAKVISVAVLKNYEVVDFGHAKFDTGYGMNVSFLMMLADFYQVSTDYILGNTDIKSPDMDVRIVSEKSGLSENSIEHSNYIKQCALRDHIPNVFDLMLADFEFAVLFSDVFEVRNTLLKKKSYELAISEAEKVRERFINELKYTDEGRILLSPAEAFDLRFDRLSKDISSLLLRAIEESISTNEVYSAKQNSKVRDE